MEVKTYIQGLKLYHLEELMFDLAKQFYLEYETLKENKGILRTTLWFKLNGSKDNLLLFSKKVNKIVGNS